MSQKWTIAEAGAAGASVDNPISKTGYRSAIHLSDGTLAMLYYDQANSRAVLAYSSDHATINTIATSTLWGSGTGSWPGGTSLTRDASDNLYIQQGDTIYAYKKGAGYTWTTTAFTALSSVVPTGGSAWWTLVWCATGGGTGAAGHLLLISSNASGNSSKWATFDAGALLNATAAVSQVNAGTPANFTRGAAPNIVGDLIAVPDATYGIGGTSGLVYYGSGIGQWGINASGALITDTYVASLTTPYASTYGPVALFRTASGVWTLISYSATANKLCASRWTATAQITAPTDYGTVTSWPSFASGGLEWAASFDGAHVWIYIVDQTTANQTDRLGCSVLSGCVWDTTMTVDDTSVGLGTNNHMRVVAHPVNVGRTDYQTLDNNAGWSLVGDYTAFASPPYAPTLTAPAPGSYVDLAGAGGTFTWTYRAFIPGTTTQTGFAIRRKLAGAPAYEYWNVGTGAWQGTVVWNPGSAGSYTFSAGLWTTAQTYNWSVATQDSVGNGPFATDSTVTTQTGPSLTVTGPTGTIATSTPTVTWSDSFPAGIAQVNYRVVVYNAAQYGAGGFTPGVGPNIWDSGVVADAIAQSRQIGVALLNATTFRAYVQVVETGSIASSWQFSQFVTAYDPPAQPLLAGSYDATNDRVILNLNAQDNLLDANTASIETDASGWVNLDRYGTVNNCTLARSTAQALNGSASIRATSVAAGTQLFQGVTQVPVVAGKTYTAVMYARSAVTARNVVLEFRWFDAAHALLSPDGPGTNVAGSTSSWVRCAATATAIANAAYVIIIVTVLGATAAGEVTYFDEFGVFPGTMTGWARGGLNGTTVAMLQYSDDAGKTWPSVRGADSLPISFPDQALTVYDYETRPGRQYRALVQATLP